MITLNWKDLISEDLISSNVFTNLVIRIAVLQSRRAVISADRYAARAPVHAVAAWFLT